LVTPSKRTVNPETISLPSEQDALRIGINRFLADVYRGEWLLSNVLRQRGISQQDIQQLRLAHLDKFISTLIVQWRIWLKALLPAQQYQVINRYYNFVGQAINPSQQLVAFSRETGTPLAKVWQLHQDALQRLRQPLARQKLEMIIVRAAKIILESNL
jgi:hypothetical protein